MSDIIKTQRSLATDISRWRGNLAIRVLIKAKFQYGNLHRKQKERRRTNHMGNCALIRYADDWLLLTNGGKAEAIRLKEEFQTLYQHQEISQRPRLLG